MFHCKIIVKRNLINLFFFKKKDVTATFHLPPLPPFLFTQTHVTIIKVCIKYVLDTLYAPLQHHYSILLFSFFCFFFVVSSYLHKYSFPLRSRTICLGIHFTLTNKTGLYPLWYSRFTNAAQLASFRIYPPTQASFLLQSEGKKRKETNMSYFCGWEIRWYTPFKIYTIV